MVKRLSPCSQFELAKRVRSLLGEVKSVDSSQQESAQQFEKTVTDINWSETLSIGVKPIDDDHQILVSLLNRCQKLEENTTDRDKLNSILIELMEYTQHHFRREEAIMKVCGYPGLKNHQQVHQLLIKQVEEKLHQHQQNNITISQLRDFLLSWVIDHIQGMDKSFAPYCTGKEELVQKAVEQLDTEFSKGSST